MAQIIIGLCQKLITLLRVLNVGLTAGHFLFRIELWNFCFTRIINAIWLSILLFICFVCSGDAFEIVNLLEELGDFLVANKLSTCQCLKRMRSLHLPFVTAVVQQRLLRNRQVLVSSILGCVILICRSESVVLALSRLVLLIFWFLSLLYFFESRLFLKFHGVQIVLIFNFLVYHLAKPDKGSGRELTVVAGVLITLLLAFLAV